MNNLGTVLGKAIAGSKLQDKADMARNVRRASRIEAAMKAAECKVIKVYDHRNEHNRPLMATVSRIPARLWGRALISQIKQAVKAGHWEKDGIVFVVTLGCDSDMLQVSRLFNAMSFVS